MVHYIKKVKIKLYFGGKYCYVKQINKMLEECICFSRKNINLKRIEFIIRGIK